jgi:hypothetical protein
MELANTDGIDVILSSPFYLLSILLTFFFMTILFYTLNKSIEYKSRATDKMNKKIEDSSEKYEVEVLNQKRPMILFVMLFALIIYNVIAWFVKDQFTNSYFIVFYEFFSGFVVFLMLWVTWLQASTVILKLFLRKYPSLDVRNYLKDRSSKLLLQYTFFWTIIYNIAFPFIIFIMVTLIHPRMFFVGMLAVLILGLIQNVTGLIKVSKE